jgi:2-aminoadipate transaminase
MHPGAPCAKSTEYISHIMSFEATSLISSRMRDMRPSLVRELLKRATSPNIIPFAGGLPNPAFFPNEELAAASDAVLRRDGAGVLQYSMSEGYPPLREWIVARYKQRFGVEIPLNQVIITSGSQQGLDLIGKVFIEEGQAVAIERPGYQGMIHALSVYQPRFVGVTLNDDGLDIDDLARVLQAEQPKLLFTCPNYQNPSGITYTAANRAAVAEVIARHNTMLIEDDPYSELGFTNKHAPTFHALLPEQCVALGSFSKIAAPGMRLGWLIAPKSVMERFVIAKQATDMHTSNFSQRVLHEYLMTNPIDAHIERIQGGYAAQCAAMLRAIEKYFPPGVTWTKPDGGMFVWVKLPAEADSVAILDAAIDAGVTFLPGPTFYTDGGGRNQMRLSYSQQNEERIEEGIKRLAEVIVRHLDGPAH